MPALLLEWRGMAAIAAGKAWTDRRPRVQRVARSGAPMEAPVQGRCDRQRRAGYHSRPEALLLSHSIARKKITGGSPHARMKKCILMWTGQEGLVMIAAMD
jgi:hypothetical protein